MIGDALKNTLGVAGKRLADNTFRLALIRVLTDKGYSRETAALIMDDVDRVERAVKNDDRVIIDAEFSEVP